MELTGLEEETVIAARRVRDVLVTGLVVGAGVFLLGEAVTGFELNWETLAVLSAGGIVLGVGIVRALSLRRGHLPTRVWYIQGDDILIAEGPDGVNHRALRRLGAKRSFTSPWVWSICAPDHQATAAVFTALRDLDIPFVTQGSDWAPGDVFHDLRKRGLLSGSFKEFAWDHLGWVVRAR